MLERKRQGQIPDIMSNKKRVLICEFHQETNTFNPLTMKLEHFAALRYARGQEAYDLCKKLPCAFHGMIDAIEEAEAEVIPTVSLYGSLGGPVEDSVLELLQEGVREALEKVGPVDAVCASLHGATCMASEEDACGAFIAWLRKLVGEDVVIAASFDLHANITETMLKNADVISGYQTYPHVDYYQTGYRAASLCMRKLRGETVCTAATIVPVMVPPSGFTTLLEPFKGVIDAGKAMVEDGTLLDFTVFNVQPWLDIHKIGSTVVAVAEDPETAKKCADILAEKFFDNRDGYWPDLKSVDEIINRAEDAESKKPVILVDASDSPNGGAPGDSVVVALRLLERGSGLKTGMFVKDPEAVAKAFEVGVGNTAEFEIGGKFSPGMPGPLKAVGTVRSLHDGFFRQEGPSGRGFPNHIGKVAVVSIGQMDIMVCGSPTASGDPQLLRHFGIEPTLYDLVVVKANTSFRAAYGAFAGEIFYGDTPGVCASNLKYFDWKNLPKGLYPFDLPEDYRPEKAKLWR